MLAIGDLAGLLEVAAALGDAPARCAACSSSSLSLVHRASLLLLGLPLRGQLGRALLELGQLLAQPLQPVLARPRSFSFFSAAARSCSCRMRRSSSSIASGLLSIAIRFLAAASSIRSIALSGRKRSVM